LIKNPPLVIIPLANIAVCNALGCTERRAALLTPQDKSLEFGLIDV